MAREKSWTFLTNHAAVLIAVARDPQLRVREIADEVGITERSAHSILADLAAEGYLTIVKDGRRNTYQFHPEMSMRRRLARDHQIGAVVELLKGR